MTSHGRELRVDPNYWCDPQQSIGRLRLGQAGLKQHRLASSQVRKITEKAGF